MRSLSGLSLPTKKTDALRRKPTSKATKSTMGESSPTKVTILEEIVSIRDMSRKLIACLQQTRKRWNSLNLEALTITSDKDKLQKSSPSKSI
jgi:hypothetical protein